MANWFARPQLARDDRYVQQCRVQGSGRMSRARIAFLLEEALRLASLPGENEGRIYYFRKVSVAELSARAGRQVWTDAVRTALVDLAARAVHGASDLAATADAVFFYNQQEALQLLLARILQREPLNRWFWPLINRMPIEATRSEKILAIIERLRELPASWLAVADAVTAAVGHGDPASLLSLLPQATVNSWLRDLSAENYLASSRPARLPQPLELMLRRSMRTMAGDDPRVLWLAALGVLCVAPSEFARGVVVSRARATLQSLAPVRLTHPLEDRRRESIVESDARSRVDNDSLDSSALDLTGIKLGQLPSQRIEFEPRTATFAIDENPLAEPSSRKFRQADPAEPLQTGRDEAGIAALAPAEIQPINHASLPAIAVDKARPEMLAPAGGVSMGGLVVGAPTCAAGLYFLLNVLRRLGIAEAVRSNPLSAELGLVACILQRLAAYAGVDDSDPILHWINLSLSQIEESGISRATDLTSDRSTLFPHYVLLSSSPHVLDVEYVSRVWSIAVRRWCWHVGGLTAREVILRDGRVSLSRSDLDVTLPLDSVDIRIRRVGLDIDPGWLPWFGRVVRFHYTWDEPATKTQ